MSGTVNMRDRRILGSALKKHCGTYNSAAVASGLGDNHAIIVDKRAQLAGNCHPLFYKSLVSHFHTPSVGWISRSVRDDNSIKEQHHA